MSILDEGIKEIGKAYKEPHARYNICTISTADHKDVSLSMQAKQLSGMTFLEIYLKGCEAIISARKEVNNE